MSSVAAQNLNCLRPDKLVSPLLIARGLIVSFFNPFRRAQAENASGQIMIYVKWGRERFNVPIPKPSITPLSTLLATLSTQTSIPSDQLKLIFKGAVLKDTNLTLTAYGIGEGSTLVLVGKGGDAPAGAGPSASASKAKGPAAPAKRKQPQTDTESVLIGYIQSLVQGLLDPLHPSIVTFISHTDPNATNKPAVSPKFDVLQKEHARLSELLLRGLLDLDGVDIPSAWTDARKERKEGVKKVQGELTRVDEAWGARKKLGA